MRTMFLAALVAASVSSLVRQNRQDTIYTLRGSVESLSAFKRKVGASWTGGTILDADPSDGVLTYWAYSDRTAAESRALMLPAIVSGLKMEFEEYKESSYFRTDRERLDEVASKCGVKVDPFFITPKKTVEITPPPGANGALRTCLSDGARPLIVTKPRQGQIVS